MIPFASERGLGQDLATHLLNVDQNEYVEVAYVRGSVAQDLHGAFAEWEAQAAALTKCTNYLYSMSINPDETQGRLTREQYLDYIARAEKKLGLENQPCAAVFHIKEGREHCHVIWSKIDVENEKTVHLAFDHDKLMTVSRQFAREHDLVLPDGYHRPGGREKDKVTLYEKHQQRNSGISKAERMKMVTDAYRQSDNAKSFVQALADKGFLLATGNRPYVLIDFYGNMNSLPKMIDDKSVRTNDLRKFLDQDFPPESLPAVDEARKLVADYRKEMEQFLKIEQREEQLSMLKNKQTERKQNLLFEQKRLKTLQHEERSNLALKHKSEKAVLRSTYLEKVKMIKNERYERRPKGLANFLGKVLGINLARKKIHKRQDKKLLEAYLVEKNQLSDNQYIEQLEQQRCHEFRALDLVRKIKGLEKVDKRELKTLEESLTREARIYARGDRSQMPALDLALTPPGRRAVPYKAINRYKNRGLEEHFKKAEERKPKSIDLGDDFSRAASEGEGTSGKGSDSDDLRPILTSKIQRYRKSHKRGQDKDRDL